MVWEDIDWVKMRNTFSGSFSITGPGSVVWVTDEGVNYDHSDLADQMRNGNTYHWRDFFAVDEDPKPRPTDNHWTHVAWTIAAKVNNW
jgi:subtilisin family serine protease